MTATSYCLSIEVLKRYPSHHYVSYDIMTTCCLGNIKHPSIFTVFFLLIWLLRKTSYVNKKKQNKISLTNTIPIYLILCQLAFITSLPPGAAIATMVYLIMTLKVHETRFGQVTFWGNTTKRTISVILVSLGGGSFC
jgi:hypothetical protein